MNKASFTVNCFLAPSSGKSKSMPIAVAVKNHPSAKCMTMHLRPFISVNKSFALKIYCDGPMSKRIRSFHSLREVEKLFCFQLPLNSLALKEFTDF